MAKLSKANTELFAEVVESVQSGSDGNFAYLDDTRYQPLVKLGLIEFNTAVRDEHTNVATRLTTKGMELANMNTETVAPEVNAETVETASTADTTTAKPVVADVIIPIPEEPKKSRRSKYPFFELAKVGASFFIPATPKDKGDMARRIKQRADALNDSERAKGSDLRFVARTIVDGTPWGEQFAGVAGAAVWRVAPSDVDGDDAE